MPIADHGNFDAVVEVNASAITTVANALLMPRVPASQSFSDGGVTGELRPRVRVSATRFPGRPAIELTLDMTGTVLNIARVQIGTLPPVDIPAGSGLVPLDGTITIQDSLEIQANALVVDFTSAGSEPIIEPRFNESRILNSPIIMLYMAARIAQGVSPDVARAGVLALLVDTARLIGRQLLQMVGLVTLMPATPPLIVQDFRTTPGSVSALCGVGGGPGSRGLISRTLLRRDAGGSFIDGAGFCVNNTSLLRDFIRPALATRLGLTPAGFIPSHPFFWTGSVPLAISGIPLIASARLTRITAGIDEVGMLHVIGSATATGVSGAFSVTVDFDVTVAMTATTDGLTLTLAASPVGTPTVRSDVSIAWWVYVGGILAGGLGLSTVLVAIDLFGGLFINGPIAGAIRTAVAGSVPPISVPVSGPGFPRLFSVVSSLSLNQADAIPRTFTMPTMGISLADGFRRHDLIVTLA